MPEHTTTHNMKRLLIMLEQGAPKPCSAGEPDWISSLSSVMGRAAVADSRRYRLGSKVADERTQGIAKLRALANDLW